MFIPPIKDKTNDTAHFIRTEIDSTDFKKENLTSKVEKDSSRKQYIYKKERPKNLESNETIRLLDEIATFESGKKAQLAAKKISEKYKKIREANTKKQKNKTSLIDNRTYQQLKDDDFISLASENKTSSFIDERTYQQLKDDYFIILEDDEEVTKIADVHKKQKQKIETIKELKKFSGNKNKTIVANKTLNKYKNMKKTKKTYSVNEEDLGTIGYSEREDLFQGESILNAANKVLDFNEFKKQQEEAIKYFKQFNEKDKNKNKRKALEKEEQIIEIIKVPKKKRKQQIDKAAQIAAKKISKKYKSIRFR